MKTLTIQAAQSSTHTSHHKQLPCKYNTQMYVVETKIICTIDTCFAVGYTAGWA